MCLILKVDPDMSVHMIDVVHNMLVLHVDLLPQLEKGNHYVSVSQCVHSGEGRMELGRCIYCTLMKNILSKVA